MMAYPGGTAALLRADRGADRRGDLGGAGDAQAAAAARRARRRGRVVTRFSTATPRAQHVYLHWLIRGMGDGRVRARTRRWHAVDRPRRPRVLFTAMGVALLVVGVRRRVARARWNREDDRRLLHPDGSARSDVHRTSNPHSGGIWLIVAGAVLAFLGLLRPRPRCDPPRVGSDLTGARQTVRPTDKTYIADLKKVPRAADQIPRWCPRG